MRLFRARQRQKNCASGCRAPHGQDAAAAYPKKIVQIARARENALDHPLALTRMSRCAALARESLFDNGGNNPIAQDFHDAGSPVDMAPLVETACEFADRSAPTCCSSHPHHVASHARPAPGPATSPHPASWLPPRLPPPRCVFLIVLFKR